MLGSTMDGASGVGWSVAGADGETGVTTML